MYFQTFSYTAFSSLLSLDVFLCSLCIPRHWNSSGQNPLCYNQHRELWTDHVCHLYETLNALCWHVDSVDSEEAVNYKLGIYIAFHAKEALYAQQPGNLSALMSRQVNAEVFCQALHRHHCLKSLKSVKLSCFMSVWMVVEFRLQLGHSHLPWIHFLPGSCQQTLSFHFSFFLLRSGQHP